MSAKPEAIKDGIQFWPIPETNAPEAGFGLSDDAYFNRRNLPEVPREYTDIVNGIFFNGGELPVFAPAVDRKKASMRFRAMISSFAPSHESKVATAGYALWVWSTPEVAHA